MRVLRALLDRSQRVRRWRSRWWEWRRARWLAKHVCSFYMPGREGACERCCLSYDLHRACRKFRPMWRSSGIMWCAGCGKDKGAHEGNPIIFEGPFKYARYELTIAGMSVWVRRRDIGLRDDCGHRVTVSRLNGDILPMFDARVDVGAFVSLDGRVYRVAGQQWSYDDDGRTLTLELEDDHEAGWRKLDRDYTYQWLRGPRREETAP